LASRLATRGALVLGRDGLVLGQGRLHVVRKERERPLLDRLDELVPAGEVVVGGRRGHPDAAGCLAQHDGIGPALAGQFRRGVDQGVAEIAVVVLTADLRADDRWKEAVAGCDYVLHAASPFPPAQPKDPDELIIPARGGTLRVLKAALDGGVRRVVVTSSSAAVRNVGGHDPGRSLTEDDWADPGNPKLSPYARSKTIAERAAWEFAEQHGETGRLAVVVPGAIIGPLLGGHGPTRCRPSRGCWPAMPRRSPVWATGSSTSATWPTCTSGP
jgi:nucleoside-diphosphate-sugar epimerase